MVAHRLMYAGLVLLVVMVALVHAECDEETCVAPNGECADDKSRCWCSDNNYGVNCENTFTDGDYCANCARFTTCGTNGRCAACHNGCGQVFGRGECVGSSEGPRCKCYPGWTSGACHHAVTSADTRPTDSSTAVTTSSKAVTSADTSPTDSSTTIATSSKAVTSADARPTDSSTTIATSSKAVTSADTRPTDSSTIITTSSTGTGTTAATTTTEGGDGSGDGGDDSSSADVQRSCGFVISLTIAAALMTSL